MKIQQVAVSDAERLSYECNEAKRNVERHIHTGQIDAAIGCFEKANRAASRCFEEFLQSTGGWLECYISQAADAVNVCIQTLSDMSQQLNNDFVKPPIFNEIDKWIT